MKHVRQGGVGLIVFLAGAVFALGQATDAGTPADAPPPRSPPERSVTPPQRVLEQYGSVFVLSRSTQEHGVQTEEYLLQGDTREEWTQLLTYQRIATAEPMGADQYVGLLMRHLGEAVSAPRFRVLQQGRDAAIFGVHYPAAVRSEEQFGVALVTVPDARRPSEIHVIQFAVSPQRVPPGELDLLVKRWQARFQTQAASLARPSAALASP